MKHKPLDFLIAVDGSENSFEAVRYVGQVLPPARTRVTLLHVLNPVPDNLWDLNNRQEKPAQAIDLASWKSVQKDSMEGFMERSRKTLIGFDYSAENILIEINDLVRGVAGDIAARVNSGFAALVLGRKGLGELQGLIFGSVTNKLIHHLKQVPVWVVGNRPNPERIILGVDGSESAMRAVRYLGDIFREHLPELLLLHVTLGLEADDQSSPLAYEGDLLHLAKEQLEQAQKDMKSYFAECIDALVERGANPNHIKKRIIPGVYSHAGAIFGEALSGDYGTIVLGRRGLSRIEEFTMGSVSSKVLQLAEEMAVWVVQ